jgi:hypothetical protein
LRKQWLKAVTVTVTITSQNKPNLFVFLISKTLFGKINKIFFVLKKFYFKKVKG